MIMPTTKAELLKFLEEKLPDNLVLESIDLDFQRNSTCSYNGKVCVVHEGISFDYSYVLRLDD